MKFFYLIIAISFLNLNSFSQAPNWQWANSAIGNSLEFGNSIATDNNGNVFVAGTFRGFSITFGASTLLNDSSSNDIFIVKMDNNGNVLWAKSAGSNLDDNSYSITTDNYGNALITGYFRGPTITFDSITLTNDSSGFADIFIAKYNALGNVLWAKSIGGKSNESGRGITTDNNGNVFVTGYFMSPFLLFGTTSLINDSSNNTTAGLTISMFIMKCDSLGNVFWAKRANGCISYYPYCIKADINGNIVVTGSFSSPSITFGAITLNNTTTNTHDIFVAKLDTNGNALWAISVGGSGQEEIRSISIDSNGNPVITGCFYGTSIIFGATTLINANGAALMSDIFIAKYNSNGNLIWAKGIIGNSVNKEGNGISIDSNDNIFVTGSHLGSSIILGVTTLTPVGGRDIFIAKYSGVGNVLWAKNVGGTAAENILGSAIDWNGDIIITGYFNSASISFGAYNLTTNNGHDVFVAKLSGTVGLEDNKFDRGIKIAPNPFTSQTTLMFSEEQRNTNIRIIDLLGQEIKTMNFTGSEINIEKGEMKDGIYFVRIESGNKNVVNRKIVLQ